MHWWTRITEAKHGRITWAVGLENKTILAQGDAGTREAAHRRVEAVKRWLHLEPGRITHAISE